MTEIIFIAVFLAWYGFSLYVSEIIGKKSRIGVEPLFFAAMLFSPLIAYIIIRISKKPEVII